MSKVTIEIEQEQIDAIIRTELKDFIGYFEADLARCEENKKGAIFSMDYEEDRKELKKHIKAFKRVLKYFSGEGL